MEFFNREKIEQYFPGAPMIPPMDAWKLPKNKKDKAEEVCASGKYFAQPKIDGSCYCFNKGTSEQTYLFSRRTSTKNDLLVEKGDRVPHIMTYLNQVLPNNTVTIMEVFYPGQKSRHVTPIMGSNPPKAIERQKNKPLHIYIHDIIMLEGQLLLNKGHLERLNLLRHIFMTDHPEVQHPSFVHVAEPIFDNIHDFIQECLDQGLEGAILKDIKGKYFPGKRPAWNFIKFKVEDKYDVICTGFDPPTREYQGTTDLKKWAYWEGDTPVTKPYSKGWIGALKLGVYKDNEIVNIGTVASGLTDAICEEIKKDPNNFLMQPMLIKAMEPTDNNLREKAFIEFRDDIDIKQCTWEKIFN